MDQAAPGIVEQNKFRDHKAVANRRRHRDPAMPLQGSADAVEGFIREIVR